MIPPGATAGVERFPDRLLDPPDVAAAHSLDLAAEFEVAADLGVVEDAEAIHQGERPAHRGEDLVRLQLQVLLVPDGAREDHGVRHLRARFRSGSTRRSFKSSWRLKKRERL